MISINGEFLIDYNGEPLKIERFPDGTPLIHPPLISNDSDVVITWQYEHDAEMAIVMFLKRHYENSNPHSSTILEMWYIPNARQDRTKSNNDVFTLKYFAEFINWLKFDEVYVLDPHSSVSEALFDNLFIAPPKPCIDFAIAEAKREAACEDIIAFFPDEGAMKRYSSQAELPYAFGVKMRDWETGKIKGLAVIDNGIDINGKDIIIIDDISSKGGTFYHSAKKLKELGARKIFLYVTHCEQTILTGEIFKSGLIEKVFTTDSIFTFEAQEAAKAMGLSEKIEIIEL